MASERDRLSDQVHLLGDLLRELLLAIDVLREESRPRFGGGPGC